MTTIKLPKSLKIFLYSNKFYNVIKFLNLKCVVKKKFLKTQLNITYNSLKNVLILTLPTENKKKFLTYNYKNIQLSYKLYIEQLIYNMFKFKKYRLILDGIGCKVWKKKQTLKFKLGYSTPYYLTIPKGIKVSIYKQRKIVVFGVNEQYIKNFIYIIRSLKWPDVYKQKGIKL
jgi:ribosomal protein L6P/L9E